MSDVSTATKEEALTGAVPGVLISSSWLASG
jgi:hypothetical protein